MTLIVSLNSNEIPSLSQVGGKGRSLIECAKAGFDNVPGGFVMSVDYFQPWMEQIQATKEFKSFVDKVQAFQLTQDAATENKGKLEVSKDDCDRIKAQCDQLQLTSDQQEELDLAIANAFGEDADDSLLVAVRSSSPEEDLAKTSFAGGYETTLGVALQKREELLKAIRHSFASLFDYRVVQYKLQNQLTEPMLAPRIAIVVQQQLNSHVSGVAFSLNPQNNCYDEAVISSNFGLGESVVAGVVTPDTFVVDKVKSEILTKSISQSKDRAYVLGSSGVVEEKKEDPAEATLNDEQILEITRMVSRVESHMTVPADIEWAIDGHGKLFLLQARPITTYIPLFPEMVTKPGEPKQLYFDLIGLWQGFDSPMSVLGLEVWSRMLEEAKPETRQAPDGHVWNIHGREYLNVSVFMGCPGGHSMVHKGFSQLGGSVARVVATMNMAEYMPVKPVASENKWMLWIMIKRFCQLLPGLVWAWWHPSTCMDGYLRMCDSAYEEFGQGGTREQARARSSAMTTFGDEINVAMRWFGDVIPSIMGFVWCFYAKWRLGRIFRGHKEAEDLLVALNMDLDGNPTSEMGHRMLKLAQFDEFQQTKSAEEFLRKLDTKDYSDEFTAAYHKFLSRFGCRGMKEIDIGTPRSYEDQVGLFQRLQQLDIHHNQIISVKERKAKAHARLLTLANELGQAKNFEYYADWIQRTGGYREHPKYMYVFMVAYLRRFALQVGQMLVEEGRLDNAKDVFHLTIDQLSEGQRDPKLNLRKIIAANLAPYRTVEHVAVWPEIIDSRGKILRAPAKAVEGGFVGDAISAGTVRGRAKVLSSPYEKPLEQGEILVTRATEPSWTPIFLNAGGVVLEVGGPLQHGAIIAREYGIPCVSGVDDATLKIEDGELLEVDGTNGIVMRVEGEEVKQ